jgi:uncharacterized protein with PQ loop repeat
MPADVLGWIASIAFFARLFPQPVRLARTGVPDGVSPLGALNAAVSDIGWILYGVGAALVPVWGTAAVALVPGIWTVVLLRRSTGRRDVVGGLVWLAVILLAWRTGAMVTILGLSVLVNQGPMVWTALRQNRLDGIAPMTWMLALADASLWGLYGVAVGDAALMGYGLVLFTSAVVILARVWWTRRAAAFEIALDPA